MGTGRRLYSILLTLAIAGCQTNPPAPTGASATEAEPSPAGSPGATTPAPTTSASEAPPAETAFAAPVDTSRKGRLRLSTVLSSGGAPLGAAPVTATITALDNTHQVIKLKDIVPVETKDALVGFRFNEEGAGPVDVRINVYRITYADGRSSRNRVTNSDFASGLSSWDVWGSGSATVRDSDQGDGRMLRLRAAANENIGMNNRLTRFTAGSDFVLTVEAAVPPAGTLTGYASVFFLWGKGLVEGRRITVPLVAPAVPAVQLVTDASGALALDVELPEGRYDVTIDYTGDAGHLAASTAQRVTVT